MPGREDIADVCRVSDITQMGPSDFVILASKLTPFIVVLATASLAFGSPNDAWRLSFSIAAVAVALLAVVLFAKRGFDNLLRGMTSSMEQLGFKRNRDQFLYAMNAEGMPHGYRTVVFVSWLGLLFSGFHFPNLALAIASTLLTLAWGYSNRRFPVDDVASS
jgi:hypothetical protein